MSENKNVRRIIQPTRTELTNNLKTKMFGLANESPDNVVAGFKKEDGHMEWFPAEGMNAKFKTMKLDNLTGIGNRNVGVDASGKLILYNGDNDDIDFADGNWIYSIATTIEDPTDGHFRVNSNNPDNVTHVAISFKDSTGDNKSAALRFLKPGNAFYYVDNTNHSKYGLYQVESTTDNGQWMDIEVSFVSKGDTLLDDTDNCNITLVIATGKQNLQDVTDEGATTSNVMSYSSHPTFGSDTQIVDKKYVDTFLGYGNAGDFLATNSSTDGYEWIDGPNKDDFTFARYDQDVTDIIDDGYSTICNNSHFSPGNGDLRRPSNGDITFIGTPLNCHNTETWLVGNKAPATSSGRTTEFVGGITIEGSDTELTIKREYVSSHNVRITSIIAVDGTYKEDLDNTDVKIIFDGVDVVYEYISENISIGLINGATATQGRWKTSSFDDSGLWEIPDGTDNLTPKTDPEHLVIGTGAINPDTGLVGKLEINLNTTSGGVEVTGSDMIGVNGTYNQIDTETYQKDSTHWIKDTGWYWVICSDANDAWNTGWHYGAGGESVPVSSNDSIWSNTNGATGTVKTASEGGEALEAITTNGKIFTKGWVKSLEGFDIEGSTLYRDRNIITKYVSSDVLFDIRGGVDTSWSRHFWLHKQGNGYLPESSINSIETDSRGYTITTKEWVLDKISSATDLDLQDVTDNGAITTNGIQIGYTSSGYVDQVNIDTNKITMKDSYGASIVQLGKDWNGTGGQLSLSSSQNQCSIQAKGTNLELSVGSTGTGHGVKIMNNVLRGASYQAPVADEEYVMKKYIDDLPGGDQDLQSVTDNGAITTNNIKVGTTSEYGELSKTNLSFDTGFNVGQVSSGVHGLSYGTDYADFNASGQFTISKPYSSMSNTNIDDATDAVLPTKGWIVDKLPSKADYTFARYDQDMQDILDDGYSTIMNNSHYSPASSSVTSLYRADYGDVSIAGHILTIGLSGGTGDAELKVGYYDTDGDVDSGRTTFLYGGIGFIDTVDSFKLSSTGSQIVEASSLLTLNNLYLEDTSMNLVITLDGVKLVYEYKSPGITFVTINGGSYQQGRLQSPTIGGGSTSSNNVVTLNWGFKANGKWVGYPGVTLPTANSNSAGLTVSELTDPTGGNNAASLKWSYTTLPSLKNCKVVAMGYRFYTDDDSYTTPTGTHINLWINTGTDIMGIIPSGSPAKGIIDIDNGTLIDNEDDIHATLYIDSGFTMNGFEVTVYFEEQ